MSHRTIVFALLLSLLLLAAAADAQSLGTFRWQLQPFCNVITVNVIQQGAVYTLDGYDDQCGAPQRAPLVGLATPNPDGSIGFGLNVVTVPGGRGVQIDARISLATLGGPWTDSAGNSGTFAFGASTGGSPRPPPTLAASPIPSTFALLTDGGFLARGTVNAGTIPASGPGTRLMWHPGKAAFRAGTVQGAEWDDANVGLHSTALGHMTTASGVFSAALGDSTVASGQTSTAMGSGTTASGTASTAMGALTTASGGFSTALGARTLANGGNSTAMGLETIASGFASTALGLNTTASGGFGSTAMGAGTTASGNFGSTALGESTIASGNSSTAMGSGTTASGTASTAMGSVTVAAGHVSTVMGTYAATTAAAPGSFVYGDRSTVGAGNGVVTSISPNQFMVRAAGGFYFYSSPVTVYQDGTPGVQLLPGAFAWSSVSDANAKENFRDLTADDILSRIANMPVREWNYKTQGSAIRHMGPTAQDFHGAFGLGEDPLRISTIDADGVALAAVRALEARTRELRDENQALRAALSALRDELRALSSRR